MKRGLNTAVQTTRGRDQTNIQAAMRLEDFHTAFVAPATVNGRSTVQLLAKLEALNPDKRFIPNGLSFDPFIHINFSKS